MEGLQSAMSSNLRPTGMKSVTDQYRDVNVTITYGHQPNLSKVETPVYTDEEHGTWKLMFERQMKALPGRASEEYLTALKRLDLPSDRIPSLHDLSAKLEKFTGWKITRVEGLVPEKEFFQCLAQKLFPCTDFIRSREELEYTPSPDMFHDIFGHLPLITNPTFASFYEAFGKAALNASGDVITELQRIYWFSVEFGLIENQDGLRIYGSGILSSVGEVPYSLSEKVRRHSFDFEKVAAQYFEIFHMQDDYFVIPSFDWLLENFKDYSRSRKLLAETI
jgi:phenylalanine-4-hydroxylase